MHRIYTAFFISTALLLGGCAVGTGVASRMFIQPKEVNLLNANYAAADTLSQRAGKNFDRNRPLTVSDIQEIPDLQQQKVIMNPRLGKVLGEQLRDRFVQLGYNVTDTAMYQGGANNAGEVSGTWEFVRSAARFHGSMQVKLRMTDRQTGQIITTYDYQLPITFDITKYTDDNVNVIPALFN